MDPTAMYFASGPNFTLVTLPASEGNDFMLNSVSISLHKFLEQIAKSLQYTRPHVTVERASGGILPVPDKSGKVLMQFHSVLTVVT